MLSVDHSNIDGPPLAEKCVRKFRSAFGGEVTFVSMCKSMNKKMNFNKSERLYEQERKYECSNKCWYEFDCKSEKEFNYIQL